MQVYIISGRCFISGCYICIWLFYMYHTLIHTNKSQLLLIQIKACFLLTFFDIPLDQTQNIALIRPYGISIFLLRAITNLEFPKENVRAYFLKILHFHTLKTILMEAALVKLKAALVKHKQREEEIHEESCIDKEKTSPPKISVRSFNTQVTCFTFFLSNWMSVVNVQLMYRAQNELICIKARVMVVFFAFFSNFQCSIKTKY